MSENHSSSAATSTVKTFFGGIVGVWGVIIGLVILPLLLCGICFFTGMMGTMMSGNNTNPSENTSNNPTSQPQETLKVEIKSFIQEFDDNQLAAEQKYKGRVVEFTGFVNNISEDILGDPYVSIKPVNEQYYFDTSIQCYFSSKDSLLSIKNDQQANFQGTFDTQSLGIIVLKNCQVI